MSNQSASATVNCEEDPLPMSAHTQRSHSPTVLYSTMQEQQQQQQHQQQQQSQYVASVPQPQQRVHVIKKNIYSMAGSNSSNDNSNNSAGSNDSPTIDMNRQIIVPPTNLNVSGNVSKSPITDIQYFPRPIKTIATISAQNATTVNPNETVNVVFRAPIVSSSSNQSMRPPPPPPPKLKGHSEEPSSSIPDLEFDGTTVLCRVCGDKASGFHYGVHSCEGCKGFFRRSIQQKIQYRPCTKNQQCSILRINRNRCQYCRLKKCIAVGMSRDAVRFGRVPKREKARILAAMQQSTQNRGHQRAMATELDDQPRLLAAVLRAHMETCEFTREKVTAMRQRARECPSYSLPTMACPLNPAPELQSEQEFSQRFAHVIRGVIDFAGMIPGFQLLTQDDKFTLLKAGLFDALFVRLICMFDTSINSIICLNGQVMRRNSIQNGANARFLVDSTFNFAERMNAMNLSDSEIGLFCAIVLISADRPGLRNIELVEKMHSRLKGCLQTIIAQNRPDDPDFMVELLKLLPDLRTLSTLHTEKLVVFRTEHKEMLRQQMWTMEEESSKSSGLSSWGCNDQVMEEVTKSPMGSVSSTESNDTTSDYSQSLSQSAPLLAATLAGGCPMRLRANSGSSAEDDIVGTHHLTQNGLTITPVVRTAAAGHHIRYRKLDSPTDSGIESGNEKADHKAASSESSSCSSPRSSVDDISEEKRPIVEDMPVLKRVLQAPPLYDTNSLMDEAYKPHKKFRALRHRESEAEADSLNHPAQNQQYAQQQLSANPIQFEQQPQQTKQQEQQQQQPQSHQQQSFSEKRPMSIANATQPQINPHQSQLHMHLTRPLQTSSSHLQALSTPSHSHQHQYHHQHHHHQPSSLSSTHSVLARSLMEEPRMTPEQMKRSDIIQNYIKRESQVEQQQRVSSHGGLLACAVTNKNASNDESQSVGSIAPKQCPFTGAASNRWQNNAALSVITTTRQHTPSPNSASINDSSSRYQCLRVADVSSPTSSSPHSISSTSPARHEAQNEADEDGQVLRSTMVSLLQPLNLSKKSPSPVQQQVLQSA